MSRAARYCFIFSPCLIMALLCGCPAKVPDLSACIPPPGKYDVEIIRDDFGVPHVYGKTNPDVAYGLAFAHCEDDFATMQESLITSRGLLATVQGVKGIPFDLLVRAFRVNEFVDAGYETQVSPDVRALCEAYADGANHYAALHPDEIVQPKVFPTNGKDVIAGFTFRMPFFYMLHRELQKVVPFGKKRAGRTARASTSNSYLSDDVERGSNAFAVAPSLSADGYTRLAVNSHQPWDGPVAWYEAHVHSEAGWEAVGGLFPGTPMILHGHNRNLGWAHTVNTPDLCDLYKLEINPENPNQYKFDGAWRDFERSEARIRMKLAGPLVLPVTRELRWSVHGPAVRTQDGTFAIRFVGYGELRAAEQFFRMNLATNFDEFRGAMAMGATLAMNTVYADKGGNIWYLYNGRFPERAAGYDWSGFLPGDTSATLWTSYLPFERTPQVFNPPSGYVMNCNSDPFQTTLGEGNPNRAQFPEWMGITDVMTNRALRVHELLGPDSSITRDEFDTYKFDRAYSRQSHVAGFLAQLNELAPFDDPLLNEALDVLNRWDFTAEPESTGAALAILSGEPIVRAAMFGNPIPDLVDTFTNAAKFLKAHYGTLAVPWEDVNRIVRGDKNLGLGGGPDTLNAVYGAQQSDGTVRGHSGDCYVLLVEWDPQGNVSSRSIHQYGSATTRPDSPHYADQVELFVQRKLKPVYFEKEELMKHAEAVYRPGEPHSAPSATPR